jgi:hypothetical protein
MIRDANAHKARLVLFDQLAEPTNAYYDASQNQLPEDRYSLEFVEALLPMLVRFAREVRTEIP